jgi:single-strand DNA-binding protein
MGYLTGDPELRNLKNDKKVVSFTVAVNRRYKRGEETVQETAFLPCEAWDSGATLIVNSFKKGDPIIVHGSIKQDNWETADGEKRSRLKLRVVSFEYLPRSSEKNQKTKKESAKSESKLDDEPGVSFEGGEDDIPF